MRTFSRTSQFRRDVNLASGRGKDTAKLKAVLDLLIDEQPLPPQCKDRPLRGQWAGSRDGHVEPDWIVICTLEDNHVRFERTDSHGDLFR